MDDADARGLELALTPSSASYVQSWPLVDVDDCRVQGSVAELPGGHHLLTCSSGTLEEYDASQTLVSERTLGCVEGAISAASRGIPLDLWDAHVGTVRASRGG